MTSLPFARPPFVSHLHRPTTVAKNSIFRSLPAVEAHACFACKKQNTAPKTTEIRQNHSQAVKTLEPAKAPLKRCYFSGSKRLRLAYGRVSSKSNEIIMLRLAS